MWRDGGLGGGQLGEDSNSTARIKGKFKGKMAGVKPACRLGKVKGAGETPAVRKAKAGLKPAYRQAGPPLHKQIIARSRRFRKWLLLLGEVA